MNDPPGPSRPTEGGDDADLQTTVHVRRAREGDQDSLSWIVSRFTPVLMAQASYRLGTKLRRICDPEDLVNDVWIIALARLADLPSRGGRFTPVVMKFLSTTLLNRLQTLLRTHIVRSPCPPDAPGEPVSRLPAATRGVITRVLDHEQEEAVTGALTELAPDDREIIVLRGIEQHDSPVVASLLGLAETATRVRYHRALKRLRQRLPASIFDEFPEE